MVTSLFDNFSNSWKKTKIGSTGLEIGCQPVYLNVEHESFTYI